MEYTAKDTIGDRCDAIDTVRIRFLRDCEFQQSEEWCARTWTYDDTGEVASRRILYNVKCANLKWFRLALLHEVGHHLNNHWNRDKSEQLQVETEAWNTAEELANKLGWDVDHELIYAHLKAISKEPLTHNEANKWNIFWGKK